MNLLDYVLGLLIVAGICMVAYQVVDWMVAVRESLADIAKALKDMKR